MLCSSFVPRGLDELCCLGYVHIPEKISFYFSGGCFRQFFSGNCEMADSFVGFKPAVKLGYLAFKNVPDSFVVSALRGLPEFFGNPIRFRKYHGLYPFIVRAEYNRFFNRFKRGELLLDFLGRDVLSSLSYDNRFFFFPLCTDSLHDQNNPGRRS